MTIYIDSECKCHVLDPEGIYTEVEALESFEGKCTAFIEGYRLVPAGCEWTRSDGVVFKGEMVSPWRDYKLLEEFQRQYEAQLAAAQAAYTEGVNSI